MFSQIDYQELLNKYAATNLELNLEKILNEKLENRLRDAISILTGVRVMCGGTWENIEGQMWKSRIDAFLVQKPQNGGT